MNSFETSLISGVMNGDPESLQALFEEYSPGIYNLAFRMCGNKEDAEDIVQSTFIQAYTHIHEFKGESKLFTWLYTIGKNQCLKLLQGRKKSNFSSLEQLIQVVQTHESPDCYETFERESYIQQVKDGCLLGLLRCLPLYQRIAFILYILLEVPVHDIARILDKSESATRLLIHHARKNIRNFLCKNCSLYQEGNPCKCENLIRFSLRQGWIHPSEGDRNKLISTITAPEIEGEINELKKITLLYHSLEKPMASEQVIVSIQEELQKHNYRIFSPKKVK